MCSKRFLFFSAAIVQNFTHFAHYCSHFSAETMTCAFSLCGCPGWQHENAPFPHDGGVVPFVFLRVPSTLGHSIS